MKIPTYLKHKPVIVSENYENVDGRYAYDSDAKGLSLGLAQWNDRGRVDISAKVWRYTGEKWSRQSEELPLHRVLDLAIMVCRAQQYFREAYRYPKLYDEENRVVETKSGEELYSHYDKVESSVREKYEKTQTKETTKTKTVQQKTTTTVKKR